MSRTYMLREGNLFVAVEAHCYDAGEQQTERWIVVLPAYGFNKQTRWPAWVFDTSDYSWHRFNLPLPPDDRLGKRIKFGDMPAEARHRFIGDER